MRYTFGHVSVDGPSATRQDAFRVWLDSVLGEVLDEDGTPPDDETIRAHLLTRFRELRKQMLSDTDWIMLEDSPAGPILKARYVAWRQGLRDLPQTYPDLRDAVLPDDPE